MKKICVITERRAEYGILKPVLNAIKKHHNLKLFFIVTGTHLSKKYGYTINEIENDFKVDFRIPIPLEGDSGADMSMSVGKWIVEITKVLEKAKPDIILTGFDIGAQLAAATAGNYMNIPVAHIHGGEISGNVDEPVRHAITKLSHIHFAATKKSGKRIIKMGEETWRVHVVGAPGLDTIFNEKLIKPDIMAKKYGINMLEPVLIIVQHPETIENKNAESQMKETMNAIKELGIQSIVIYPNADAGGRGMINIIEKYRKYPFIHIYKNMPHIEYLSLMNMANAIIGNSSSGIIEAPLFHLPFVNIGERQIGREKGSNVIDVASSKEHIKKAIKMSIYDKKFRERIKRCKSPYGDGKAGIRIANILSEIKIDKKLLQKKMTY